jgi:AraC-like DNA-binding protein
MAIRMVGEHPRYQAVPPNLAVGAALHAAGQKLARAHRRSAQLATAFRAATQRSDPRALVEVVIGRQAIAERLEDLERSVRHEIRVCDAPPYSTGEHQPSAMEPELLRRGVRCRVLYDRVGLEAPGRLADVAIGIAAGEQTRVTDVPTKLVLSDFPRALLPLQHDPDHVETSLIVHDSVLCDALSALFEMYWERAIPLEVRDGSAHLPDPRDAPTPEERDLLPLLAAGLTDRAIAAELGCSERTVRRRLKAMFERLDATTRTQAGYQAVARGWLAVHARVSR